jgi:hypothetical protein
MKTMAPRAIIKSFLVIIFLSVFAGKGIVELKASCDNKNPILSVSSITRHPEKTDHKYKFPVKNVDYSDPSIFIIPTSQTELSPKTIETLNNLFPYNNNIKKIGKVHNWVKENFQKYRGGGRMVAKKSAQQLYDERKLSGCNDWGLLQTAILRSLNFPVVFMNAANINWAKEYKEDPSNPPEFSGHTFLEIYVKGRWILMDSTTGQWIEDYDFNDPVLHIHKKRGGYFVYQKGLDHWTMGIKSIEDNKKIMRDFALNYPLEKISIQNKKIQKLNPSKK